MMQVAYALTGAWLLGWAVLSFIEISRDRRQATPYLVLVHVLLTGLPIVLDLLAASPEYRAEPGFYIANQDVGTVLVYCSYVSLCPVLWWAMRGRRRQSRGHLSGQSFSSEGLLLGPWRPLFWLMVVSPLVALATAPVPGAYLRYAYVTLNNVPSNVSDHHQIVAMATVLSSLGAGLLLASRPRLRMRDIVAMSPWLIISFWLNGKRTIVFTTLALLCLVVWNRHVLGRGMLVAASAALLGALVLFTLAYQTGLRGIAAREAYESIRIDFARDNAIKMAIYAELHPERMSILQKRGQSLLFNIVLFVPREMWPAKPLPYAQYFTSAMLGTEPRMWGWGMTTSWLGEALSNAGWLGLLLGPLTLGLMARLADARGSPLFSALTVLVTALLMAVQVVAFLPLFVCWLMAALGGRRGRSRQRVARARLPASRIERVAIRDRNGGRRLARESGCFITVK
jgi:hypothetical protein